MAATENLPLAFAALLAGGLLLEHGTATVKAAFAGGTQAGATGTTAGGTAADGSTHGQVTKVELAAIGAAHGWTPAHIDDWMKVIMAESNGTTTDTNPASGAYGIAQGITGPSWYYEHGGDPYTVTGQLTAMANYISQRYGNPSAAWAHEQQSHWY